MCPLAYWARKPLSICLGPLSLEAGFSTPKLGPRRLQATPNVKMQILPMAVKKVSFRTRWTIVWWGVWFQALAIWISKTFGLRSAQALATASPQAAPPPLMTNDVFSLTAE